MTFKNETSDRIEICVPVTVTASVRFWIEEGEELTAALINDKVDQAAYAAGSDVIRLLDFHGGDMCMNVLGVEPGGSITFYNKEAEGEADMPDDVDYAEFSTTPAGSAEMSAAISEILACLDGLGDENNPDDYIGRAIAVGKRAMTAKTRHP